MSTRNRSLLQRGLSFRWRASRRLSSLAIAAALSSIVGASTAQGVVLTPNDVFMSAYHFPILNSSGVPETRANALTVLTNGVVDRGGVDRIDTWNSDHLGQTLDFVGLQYATPSRFDEIVIEQGTQFGDGGDWEAMPKIYILKSTTLVGDTVEPNMIPQWVEVTGATTPHVFPADTTGAVAEQVRFDLSAISAADRTGWGWAVGGVDGNDTFHFLSFTEVWAEGEANQPAPAPLALPAALTPVNVVANSYGSPGRNGDGLVHAATHSRGQAFAGATNGLLDSVVGLANDGFDTYSGDTAGVQTDFAGLQYSSRGRFDTITVNLGNQFGDGGDWDSTPRIFILKNPVDTSTTRPEDDPTNWHEIVGATETTGHTFSPLVTPGPGGTFTFDLTGIHPSQRTGWGWAVGGVDGNANDAGAVNFVSITELSATGTVVPEPSGLVLAAIGGALVLCYRRKL
jgi:hypothetical protein